jgi:hypothetical protein
MPAIQFGGEEKWRGEWGLKRGESAALFLGEDGLSGWQKRMWEVVAAAAGGLPEE